MTSQWKDQPGEWSLNSSENYLALQRIAEISEIIYDKITHVLPFQSLLSHYDREGSGNVKLHDLRYMLQNLGTSSLTFINMTNSLCLNRFSACGLP
ncbi:unnamed protein product [Angiostrongylus costaricensis]|uniref:EF-hand domain-containing protein n=1 Tax=Angiostrongylus costaricensis TaxID=334426 RepID=A0A0R3PF74_ANGCS|nr:unnamed protein product [Angiostrongylus costaricensis]